MLTRTRDEQDPTSKHPSIKKKEAGGLLQMLRDFPLLLKYINTRQILQIMKVERRDFSKDYEKT